MATIDWDGLEEQHGDDPPVPFSYLADRIVTPQIPCHITNTTSAGHEIIRQDLKRSPMYSGQIESTGPRYCPSIERQGRPICRTPKPSDLPGARGFGRRYRISERHLDLVAGRCAAGPARYDPRLRAGNDGAARLCDRIRLRRSARIAVVIGDQTDTGPFSCGPNQWHDGI